MEDSNMPIVSISLQEGKSEKYIQELSGGVHNALVDAMGFPEVDRFQLITEHKKGHVIADNYLDVDRTDDIVIIQITFRKGRSIEQKKTLYHKIMENLVEKPGMRKEDIMIVLTENNSEDWSFGNGEAQYI
jgi:phenylpyruvate tautomerase PptA (4-oxalocrotonate tautomerase family)